MQEADVNFGPEGDFDPEDLTPAYEVEADDYDDDELVTGEVEEVDPDE